MSKLEESEVMLMAQRLAELSLGQRIQFLGFVVSYSNDKEIEFAGELGALYITSIKTRIKGVENIDEHLTTMIEMLVDEMSNATMIKEGEH